MRKQPNSRYCFLCGLENPLGLKLAFYTDEQHRCVARWVPREEYQGYPGVLHGGIASALLDETIGRTLVSLDIWAMTAQLNVRFAKPVPLGQEITVIGEMVRLDSRLMEGRGEIRLKDGSVAVTAEAKYIRLNAEKTARFREGLGFWEVVPDAQEGEGASESVRAPAMADAGAGDETKPGPDTY